MQVGSRLIETKYEMTEDQSEQGPKWMHAIGNTYII